MNARALAAALICALALSGPLNAQQPDGDVPQTRGEVIAAQRADKVAELWPERQSGRVNRVNRLVERGFHEGIDSGRGVNGPQIVLGGMRAGQGLTGGLGYLRSDLWNERLSFRPTVRATFTGAYLFDADLDFHALRSDRTSLRWYTKFESSPLIDFYGLGNDSSNAHHTGFAYDDVTTDFDARLTMVKRINLGLTGGYLFAHTAQGSDEVPPIGNSFPGQFFPGLGQDTHFSRIGVFAVLDLRDSKTGPRSGGLYGARYREYWDVDRKSFAFRQTEFEFQQYFPYSNKTRVLALRSAVVLSYPKEGDQLPIYLLPTLGGNDDLRGFGNYRFRDNHSIYLGLEHRWQVASNLDMAAFVDAGKAVPLKRDLEPLRLHYSGGLGVRLRVRSAVVSRVDFAGSAEGFRLVWTFSDIYGFRW